jgi:O-antigen/teichoic acid export membrane protein
MKIRGKNLGPVAMAKEFWALFCDDSLFRNSIYLMMSTGVMSGLGFVFWVITTRYYDSEEVGFATALISITVTISSWSLFGLNSALVRYLAQSPRPNRVINTSLLIVSGTTIAASALYLLGIDYFSPAFHMLAANPFYAFLFVLFMIAVSLNSLTDSVFIAHRLSKYNLIVYTFFGLTKIILPLFLISLGGYGVFFSYSGAVLVSLALSIYFMVKKFDYRPQLVFERDFTKQAARFSMATYTAGFISGLPGYLAPIFILNEFGAKNSAYFYMASTIANLLNIIPQAISQSLFAEGSFKEDDFAVFAKKAVRYIGIFLIPAVLLIFIFGKYVLLIFGEEYSQNSYQMLQILAIMSLFLAIVAIGSIIMKIKHQMKAYIGVNAVYFLFTVALFYVLTPFYGTMGIVWGLLGGEVFLSLCFIFIYRKHLLRLFVR